MVKALKAIASFVLFLTTFARVGSAYQLEGHMMLRTDPGDCTTAVNSTLTPVTTFLTTDAKAYLWFYVTGTNAGDQVVTDYYSPSGQLYIPAHKGPWQPVASGGNICFKEWALEIAGAAPATMLGQWRVEATYNGAPLFTLTFTITTPLAIDTTSPLPNCNVGASCVVTLRASGGSPPYAWSLNSGSGALPSGLSLNSSTGTISGTPSVAGTYNFTVRVTDSVQATATKAFVLTVAQVVPSLSIQTASPLPAGTVGVAYSVTLAATGGTAPYRWSLSSGSLPPGLSLASTTGVISGTPTAAGSYNFTVQVTDNAQATASKAFALTVPPPVCPLQIQTASPLPTAAVTAAYSTTLSATCGTQPYRWSLSSGSLPPGLALGSTTGIINGTPTTPGLFSFTMRVTDNAQPSATATKALAITVIVPPCGSPSITGLAGTADPATQPQFGLRLETACPLDLTGQVSLSFSPDAVVPADDPAIQFVSTHNRTLDFTIRAGSQQAEFATGSSAFQTGTVAGTITVRVTKLSEAGVDVMPSSPASQAVRVDRRAPTVKSARFIPSASSFDVEIVGYSTPREVTQGVFQFTPASGANLQTTRLTVDLRSKFSEWYAKQEAVANGSQFKLVITFNVLGEVSAISAVSVTLSNGQESSASVTAGR